MALSLKLGLFACTSSVFVIAVDSSSNVGRISQQELFCFKLGFKKPPLNLVGTEVPRLIVG